MLPKGLDQMLTIGYIFPLFHTHFWSYPKTKKDKTWTKDNSEPQQL